MEMTCEYMADKQAADAAGAVRDAQDPLESARVSDKDDEDIDPWLTGLSKKSSKLSDGASVTSCEATSVQDSVSAIVFF